MINTPGHVSDDGLDDDDNVIYESYVFDQNGDLVCEADSPEFAIEIVKRINLHDELVAALKYSVDFMEDRAATKYDLDKVSEFRKLLEQCK